MKSEDQPITFVISGQRRDGTTRSGAAASATLVPAGRIKASVRVGARRGGGDEQRVTAVPGEDVVVLHLTNGPSLTLHPATARDLMMAQGTATRSGAAADTAGEVVVPVELQWRGLEQTAPTRSGGFLGKVLLSAVDIVTGLFKDDDTGLADFAASAVVRKVDSGVDAGVYSLRPDELKPLKGSVHKLADVPAAPGGAPILVLVHGTFVDTVSTFGKLWALHGPAVQQLFSHYGGRVYALDHPTLGASPMANALTLVSTLPKGARLHLVTHSRGGLVAEVLARLAGQRSLSAAELALFAGPPYAGQRAELQALLDEIIARDVHVERIVRVACPARGTLLASRRFDAYLSVLQWTLQLGGVPVLPSLVDLLSEVARRRADPLLLPGLAAMVPDSPLVQWLNTASGAIAGDLRVVAGDLEGDSISGWLKTLLADAFYWTDNDIVVHTASMYGGTPREGGARFLLDQGGKVTHFAYFANQRTVDAVVGALTLDQPAGFGPIGPLSWAGKDSSGVRAAKRAAADPRPAHDKPAVFMLPGILGSNLKAGDDRIWLGPQLVGGLKRLAYSADSDDGVRPDGPIGLVYDDLMDFLAATHEVRPFAFDWRRPIEQEAQRLGAEVEAALDARKASGQPVRLIAHSMGGVLARTMQLECPDVWKRLMAHADARLLMLGTPNGGSWAPMQVLSGDDTFGNALVAFGAPFQDRKARQLMAAFPGFIQLQADLLDPARKLALEATWRQLADDDLKRLRESNWWHRNWLGDESMDNTLSTYQWGVPPQTVLDQAKTLRQRLDQQRDGVLKDFADKLLLVVGHAKFTPDGFEWGDRGLTYLDAIDGGDGRVTLASAMLPGVRTWTLDCEHGSLPSAKAAFDAFLDLLMRGDTSQLQRLAGGTRSAGASEAPAALVHARSRPSRAISRLAPAGSMMDLLGSPSSRMVRPQDAPAGGALRVSVLNGNLTFVRQPLLVGHYRSLVLTGTERVIDRQIGGTMSAALGAGLYPSEPGSYQVFVNTQYVPNNPWQLPAPSSAIVIGLGDEGGLRETNLTMSVRQGVLGWAHRVAEQPGGAPSHFEIAATLMGSGGIGISAGSAARAIAQGVREANDRLNAAGWPCVSRLVLVELYLERATDAWRGLQLLGGPGGQRFDIAPTVEAGTGPLRRQIDNGYRGADYDLISATTPENVNAEGGATSTTTALEQSVAPATAGVPVATGATRPRSTNSAISYRLDTRRARTEVRAQVTQGPLLRELVSRASTDTNRDPLIGRTLFQLLVPPELEAFLSGTSHMVLELDHGTAPIPWELLDTVEDKAASGDPRPWAVRCQLLRKLRLKDFRERVQDATSDDAVLVIGEPKVDLKKYGKLPGALAEAKAVVKQLTGPGGIAASRVVRLVDQDDATAIINALLQRRYRIVHIAGHGEPGGAGGVVMSGDTFLGPREIESMRTVPELVFVNCCHLAARDAGDTLRPFDRSEFAANVAESLIGIGVRCVVAAGWAVEDAPAETFATTFYRELLAGATFIRAVAKARETTWDGGRGGNTWAAYQCYGDPNWVFDPNVRDAQQERTNVADEYAGISSPLGLALALEELAVQSKWQGAPADRQLAKIRFLESRFGGPWRGMGAIAEAFGLACAEAGDVDAAIGWYEEALQSNDASASLKVAEQLGNQRARRAWKLVSKASEPNREKAIADGRKGIESALALLEPLAALQPTIERLSLCGSAWKRLAMIEALAGQPAEERAAIVHMTDCYRRAEGLAANSGHPELHYPALNRMAGELVVEAANAGWVGIDPASIAAVRDCLQARVQSRPDFWDVAGLKELAMLEALGARTEQGTAARSLAAVLPGLSTAFAELHSRVKAGSMWASVADQAHFVLTRYQRAGSAEERAAAQALLDQLQSYAAGG
jgi:tetratricopeptide (TPR) repeat protein